MAGKDVTIRAQALDGTWQTIGGESARGVFPEGVVLEYDGWGCLAASFDLHRDPRAFWPDITAFTPIEVYVASLLVWSGRVRETPSQVAQRVMNVQCEGWQFHLDDDIYQGFYVHDNLVAWKDQRSVPTADLTTFRSAPQVGIGSGVGTIIFPKDLAVVTGDAAGITLDCGPGAAWTAVAVDWERVGPADGNWTLYGRGSIDPSATAGGADAITDPLSGAGGTSSGPFGIGYRYVHLFLFRNGPGGTEPADSGVRIKDIRVFADYAYASGGGTSLLKASTVARDALSRGTVLLSGDLSGITDTSFDIPSYAPDWKTPRQAWSAVNAYHDWLMKIDVARRPVYESKPSRPIFEVGIWSAINDDDASANSGAEIYNRAIGVASAPDGSPVLVDGVRSDEVLDYTGIDQIPNPSADVNASSWTVAAGILTRTTGTFDSSPACFEITSGGGTPSFDVSAVASAQLRPLQKYRLSFALLPEGMPGDNATVSITTTPSNRVYSRRFSDLNPLSAGSAWETHVIDWLQPASVTDTGYTISIVGSRPSFTNPHALAVDSFDVGRVVTTLVDRRGFNRSMQLPVGSTLPADGIALKAIGGVWLNAHKTTPFRGGVTLVGDESVREILTGRPVGLETLGLNTGQLLRFSDRPDPDTAGHGRDGRIAHVSYTPGADTAVVTIDNSRTSFDALLARNAVIQGG